MCWRTSGYHTSAKQRKCGRCKRAIEPGQMYLQEVHVPDSGCSYVDVDRDTDTDCGTDGFQIYNLCSSCLGLRADL